MGLNSDKLTNIARQQFHAASGFHVAVGTNGYKGGDAGHGSRTFFQIQDAGGTDTEIALTPDGRGVTIQLGGDSELSTFARALEFAAQTLRSHAGTSSSD
jgi:hypothetical protein